MGFASNYHEFQLFSFSDKQCHCARAANRVGFIIEAMENFLPYEELKPKIGNFGKSHAESPVNVVAKKAKKILKKF